MANWREDYYAALVARDDREQANSSLYDAYTRLADRTAATSAGSASNKQQPQTPESAASQASSKRGIPAPILQQQKTGSYEAGASLESVLLATRTELAAAQRSRSELQDQLTRTTTELDKLKSKTQQDTRRIASLEGERTHLTLRLRDRDEELRGKAKLLDNVQDELASLNLQLNMAEDRSTKLQKENKELVDRWMVRMGKEADAMNEASRF